MYIKLAWERREQYVVADITLRPSADQQIDFMAPCYSLRGLQPGLCPQRLLDRAEISHVC